MHGTVGTRRGPRVHILLAMGLGAAMSAHADAPPPLTMAEAIARSLADDPGLAEWQAGTDVAAARVRQAAMPPNPELSVEVENFGWFGGHSDAEGTQTTVMVGQRLEPFGRRGTRRDVAAAAERAHVARTEAARRALEARTIQAFDDVLSAEARLALADDLLQLTRADARAADARARTGAASPVEQPRAAARIARAEVAHARRRIEVASARAALAALWRGTSADIGVVVGTLAPPARVPPLDELRALAAESSQAAALAADVDRRDAAVTLERLGRLPDVTVRVGARRFHDAETNALVAELVVPLPIFDRNQAGLAAAVAERDQMRATARRVHARIEADLAAAHATLVAAATEVTMLERDGIPAAHRALDAARRGFTAGALGQLDVIEAARDVFDLRSRRLDAAERACRAATTIDRLAGTSLRGDTTAEGGADR